MARVRVIIGTLLLVFNIVSLWFFYRQFSPPSDIAERVVYTSFIGIYFAISSGIIIDRLASVLADVFNSKESEKLEDRFKALPRMVSGRNDIVVFHSPADAVEYCISESKKAYSVKNTVLRYGLSSSSVDIFGDDLYKKWIDAKHKSISSGAAWSEIVSTHFDDSDPQISFINSLRKSINYRYKKIDDRVIPMMQMTIFSLENGDEAAVFGWFFPEMQQGPSFLTRNQILIRYLDSYFKHHMDIAKDTTS